MHTNRKLIMREIYDNDHGFSRSFIAICLWDEYIIWDYVRMDLKKMYDILLGKTSNMYKYIRIDSRAM